MHRLIMPLFFGIAGTLVLVSLGTWQVQRLAWKEAILAEINARIDGAPVALPLEASEETDKYLPVEVAGVMTQDEVHVLASAKKIGPVYRVISAFETEDGRRILVDRGYIPTTDKDDARPEVSATIFGNLHWPDEIDSYTPENDVTKNIWFARDVSAMAQALGAEPLLIILRDSSESDRSVTPMPVTSAGIPNDHLQYAVTWFGLAIVWLGMTLYYLRRMRSDKKA